MGAAVHGHGNLFAFNNLKMICQKKKIVGQVWTISGNKKQALQLLSSESPPQQVADTLKNGYNCAFLKSWSKAEMEVVLISIKLH